ncbi:cytochrome P450 [Aspergillus pseudodeflectus]|uniref:Cytochrome P450 n=1 Tax=Aspergillus pseudodeflectus TaxID=176178 RepID=A0ABR4KTW4_9EURO
MTTISSQPGLGTTNLEPGCPFTNPQNLHTDLAHTRAQPSIEFSPILNGYIISRYDDILRVLDNPSVFASRGVTVPDFPDPVKPIFASRVPEGGTLLGWDNPDHDRLRASVAGFFIPRKLARFQPLMAQLAHELIDGFVREGEVEIKSRFALPLPLKMITAVAGLDPARWRWIGRCLSLFGGITEVEGEKEELSIERKVQDVLDLHDYVARIIQERKHDRRDDLISHIWDVRDSGAVTMTDFEHLAMIPGLLLAGHETTTSVLTMGLAHLLHHGLWEEATAGEASIAGAIEELLRYESAITGMPRVVREPTTLGDRTLNVGDRVFLAYSSGSRDDAVFECSAQLQLGRKFPKQHLGFGRGMHACLGAPLARLLLKTEMMVLRERLPGLRLVTPYEEIRYEKVGASRGVEGLVVAWDLPKSEAGPRGLAQRGVVSSSATIAGKQKPATTIPAVVKKLIHLTDEILEVTIAAKSTTPTPLPSWQPGAHIDILSPHGYRQYSLCSNPLDLDTWTVAIRKEGDGSGGSIWFHGNLDTGTELTVRGPRNHFRLQSGQRYVFIAGGIGITPIRPMLEEAQRRQAEYKLVYLGRSRRTMAYHTELARDHPGAVEIWAGDENANARFDIAALLARQQEGTQVYCCGPERLVLAVEDECRRNPKTQLRVERFHAATTVTFLPNRSFDVALRKSGRTLTVPAEKSLLDVLNQNGCGVMSTCSKGTCGTCEVRVLEGEPEHRDSVLSPEERSENTLMMPCVSRCLGERLVLDLW